MESFTSIGSSELSNPLSSIKTQRYTNKDHNIGPSGRSDIRNHRKDDPIPTSSRRSFRADISPVYLKVYDLAHVPGWEPHNRHDLGHFSCVGSVLQYTDLTQHIITAG